MDAAELRSLAVDLGRAAPAAITQSRVIVQKTGHGFVADAQAFAPVDTGFLRSSIGVDFHGDGLGFDAGPTASYGHFVEGGTSRMAPQPYVRPAWDRRVPQAVEAFEQIGGRVLP
jgi:HK97 gp10 family phage protein